MTRRAWAYAALATMMIGACSVTPRATPDLADRLTADLQGRLSADQELSPLLRGMTEVSARTSGFTFRVQIAKAEWDRMSFHRRERLCRIVGQHMMTALTAVQSDPRSIFGVGFVNDADASLGFAIVAVDTGKINCSLK